ncbi:baseplate hub + tail lysozyme [Agrobacterium phage OLIVR5]|uniref:Baseplate hub + tail lysozyme n=1 Tax=Agrobacterium phage OLIVR5 TaxID=2723773 RepID=A0A858MSS9_9CAUD|nr:baseplate hub subunit and tail lysozyme [Agrobacterium phage OLIVR5]QIW87792.1 baseplate hub + tail lysozyme [Agrobacterium phage OLIVR5]QIW88057.1 baseplate hub + tail lysozyme [Agrobacterium phage OLIVR6]
MTNKTEFENPYDLFGGTVGQIPDLQTATQKIREEIRVQVPASAGLSLTRWFKDPIKAFTDPFRNFNFRFKKGRVSFEEYERNFAPQTPNILQSANPMGFDEVISIFETLFDDLTEDERQDYDAARYKIHIMLRILETRMEMENGVDFIRDNFAERDISFILRFSAEWREMISNTDVSLRDQLIDLRTYLMLFYELFIGVAFEAGRYEEKIKNYAALFSNVVVLIDEILIQFPNELEVMVERLANLLTYTPAKKIHRYRLTNLAGVLKNPLFKFVKSDYIRTQSPSTNVMATSFARKEVNPRDQIDAAQASLPTARLATPDIGVGDKIQANAEIDTIPYTGTVGPLTTEQFEALRRAVRQRESGGDYSAVNRYGFSGAYQFGGPALQDLGYAKKGTSGKGLKNPNNWTGKNGITSLGVFLQNRKLQDDLFVVWMKLLYKRCLSVKAISESDTPAQVAGIITVAHLLGAGGARDFKNGKDGADGNGTKASEYYNLGKNAVGGSTTVASADEAIQNSNAASMNTLPDSAMVTVPEQSAAPVYPYNKVKATESGHFEEYDDTPGAERIQVRHRKGSGYELKETGDTVYFSSRDSYDAVLGNNFIVVSGLCNIYVKGDCGIVSEGNVNINAGQDLNLIAGGDVNVVSGGNHSVRVSGSDSKTVEGDAAHSYGGFLRQSSDGDMQLESSSFTALSRNGNTTFISKGDVNTVTSGSINQNAVGSISSVAKGNIISVSYGDQTLTATGKMVMSGDSLIANGKSNANVGSDGSTTIAGSGVIKLGAPVEKSLFADSAGIAPDGPASPVSPSGSSSDGGAGQVSNDNKKKIEEKPVAKIVEEFSASDFNKTQARTGGGEGSTPSTTDPYTFA